MRKISSEIVTDAVKNMCISANCHIDSSVKIVGQEFPDIEPQGEWLGKGPGKQHGFKRFEKYNKFWGKQS